MRIGTNERVRQRNLAASDLAYVNHGGEVLNIDLVDDAHARWHDTQPTEGTLAPAEEAVALAVALVLALDVLRERVLGPEGVDLDRVVDHEVDRHVRVDVAGVAAHQSVRIAHGSKVGDRRNTSEVLQDHTRRNKRHRCALWCRSRPRGKCANVGLRDVLTNRIAQLHLEQHADGIGQCARVNAGLITRGDREIVHAVNAGERTARVERICCRRHPSIMP